jgi:hypothetical protein
MFDIISPPWVYATTQNATNVDANNVSSFGINHWNCRIGTDAATPTGIAYNAALLDFVSSAGTTAAPSFSSSSSFLAE